MGKSLAEKEEEAKVAVTEHRAMEHKVLAQILKDLGSPAGFHSFELKHLFEDRYRANVRVTDNNQEYIVSKTRIAHSYFVQANEQGQIMRIAPAIRRSYQLVSALAGTVGAL